jgi:hypothetical protein
VAKAFCIESGPHKKLQYNKKVSLFAATAAENYEDKNVQTIHTRTHTHTHTDM